MVGYPTVPEIPSSGLVKFNVKVDFFRQQLVYHDGTGDAADDFGDGDEDDG